MRQDTRIGTSNLRLVYYNFSNFTKHLWILLNDTAMNSASRTSSAVKHLYKQNGKRFFTGFLFYAC